MVLITLNTVARKLRSVIISCSSMVLISEANASEKVRKNPIPCFSVRALTFGEAVDYSTHRGSVEERHWGVENAFEKVRKKL